MPVFIRCPPLPTQAARRWRITRIEKKFVAWGRVTDASVLVGS